ncbi:MAG TPA: GntR family transcriptional regulator [Steroidobacteraceae bacterium]|nr:GntR family transcriptional regulator [Steroidobacteraceae bacterium]
MEKTPSPGRRDKLSSDLPDLRLLDAPGVAETSLNGRAYRILRQAILSGAFEPGSRLNIRPLAAMFEISPMPVREALYRLRADGAVEALPNRAFRLPFLSAQTYRELVVIRLRLESLACEAAVIRARPEQIVGLRDLYARLVEQSGRSLKTYLSIHRQFHFSIYEIAEMPELHTMIETLWLRLGPLMHASSSATDLIDDNRRHGKLLNALASGDAGSAVRALSEDMSQATAKVLAFLAGQKASSPALRDTAEPQVGAPEPAFAAADRSGTGTQPSDSQQEVATWSRKLGRAATPTRRQPPEALGAAPRPEV